jgi:hypothetical protein
MDKPNLAPETKFSLLLLIVAVLIILAIMNKWI